MSRYFIKQGTEDDAYPERIVAPTNSDAAGKLAQDDSYTELTHSQFKATFSKEDWEALPAAIQTDSAPAQSPKAADDTAAEAARVQRAAVERAKETGAIASEGSAPKKATARSTSSPKKSGGASKSSKTSSGK